MKFKVTMKTPDALEESIINAVGGDSEDAAMQVAELCEKWFRHDELLTVEIDTEVKTCTVVPVK